MARHHFQIVPPPLSNEYLAALESIGQPTWVGAIAPHHLTGEDAVNTAHPDDIRYRGDFRWADRIGHSKAPDAV